MVRCGQATIRRLGWISHLNRSQELFFKTMEEGPWRQFRDHQGCQSPDRPRVPGLGDRDFVRWATCVHLWDIWLHCLMLHHIESSLPHTLVLCSLVAPGATPVGPSVVWATVATPPKSTGRNLWWFPCGALSAGAQNAQAWRLRLPLTRLQRMWLPDKVMGPGLQLGRDTSVVSLSQGGDVATPVGLEGRTSSQRGLFLSFKS